VRPRTIGRVTSIEPPGRTGRQDHTLRPRRRRSDQAVENDARILRAALVVLREEGYDGLGMRHVARAAELKSTGALYSRFENVAELAVWIWAEEAWCALRSISERAIALLDGVNPDDAAEDEARAIAAELVEPDDALRAAIELLAVVPRVEELDEVVRPDIATMLAEAGATVDDSPRRRAVVLSQLSLVWGIALLSLPGTLPPFEWWRVLSGTIGLGHEDVQPVGTIEPVDLSPPPPAIDPGSGRLVLLGAAGQVMARSGVERATLSRIARLAGYSTGVIYEYFSSKDDLVNGWVEAFLDRLYSTTAETEGSLLSAGLFTADAGRVLAGFTRPEARRLQRLKVELYVAAAHHPAIAESLGEVFGRHTAEVEARYLAAGMGPDEAAVAPGASQVVTHGIALVESVAWPVQDVDWRFFAEPLLTRYL
jgi:AcrR family transcriptional regulator